MTNEEIEKVEEIGKIDVLQDEEGNVINLDENDELKTMGKGDEEDDK